MDELIKWLREQIKEINSNEDFETGMIVAYGNVLYKIHEIKQKKQQHSEYPGIRFKDQKMANDIIKEQGIGFTAVHAEPYKQMAMYNALAHNAASVTNEPISVYELGKQIHEAVEEDLEDCTGDSKWDKHRFCRHNNCKYYYAEISECMVGEPGVDFEGLGFEKKCETCKEVFDSYHTNFKPY